MAPIAVLAPVWICFEVLQLIYAERYLGVRQIHAGEDPRREGPSEFVSFVWSFLIFCYVAWIVGMLCFHLGSPQVVALTVVCIVGYLIRRSCGLKWVLVVLTFEGAIRIGMLVSLCALLWRDR